MSKQEGALSVSLVSHGIFRKTLTLPEPNKGYPQYGVLPPVPIEVVRDLDARIHVDPRPSDTLQLSMYIIRVQEALGMIARVFPAWSTKLEWRCHRGRME